MSKRIVLTGGGTCGHIMPNIALLPRLKQNFENIFYLGEGDSMEERLAQKHNLTFYPVPSIKFERRKIWKNLAIPTVMSCAVKKAVEIFKLISPSVVFSKGGYVSLPACYAAKKLNIPLVIHESDSTLGVANKLTAKFATKVITSHKSTPLADERYIYLGNPIRQELLIGNKTKLAITLKLRPKMPTILIFGGSLGAKAINEVISQSLYELTNKYNVLHIVGNNTDIGNNKIIGYYPVNFADNIGDYYAAADLIISRAGASAVTEISALGKRVIYIPLPKGNSRGDQVDNAMIAMKEGRALVIEQDKATKQLLLDTIAMSFDSPPPPKNYDSHTVEKIVSLLASVCK